MKIIISNEAERMTVAGILVKNGYRVSQAKIPKTPTSKVNVFCLVIDKPGENEKGA